MRKRLRFENQEIRRGEERRRKCRDLENAQGLKSVAFLNLGE